MYLRFTCLASGEVEILWKTHAKSSHRAFPRTDQSHDARWLSHSGRFSITAPLSLDEGTGMARYTGHLSHLARPELFLPIQTTEKIWHNGALIPWADANIHVMSHVVHYGSSVFEGIRAYAQGEQGAGIFRLQDHMQRFLDSARIYRMPLPYNLDELCSAVVETVESNQVAPCYIRPVAFRGYGEIGVNPMRSPVEVYVANFPWGNFIANDTGADVCVSSWNRLAPNTMPSLAKAGANYMNSQLIRMEAEVNGYAEGIALDRNGYLSEGSGENLFLVRDEKLYTSPLANSVLNGITRASVIQIAREMGIEVVEQAMPREMLYLCHEAFFTGTAAEVTHLRSVDRIVIGDGSMGPITRRIHDDFFSIVNGIRPDRFGWLTPVRVRSNKAVGEPVNA